MSITKYILLFILLLFGLTTKEQILGNNLIHNPSFEEYDTCPSSGNQLNLSKNWWGLSTEYFNTCATISSQVSIPSNFAGIQYAKNGNAYSGFIIYGYNYTVPNNEYKESIKTKLKDSLNINKRYCTNFYMSLAEFSYLHGINMILLDSAGILFTRDSVIDFISVVFPLGIKVQNAITNLDTISWLKITNTFVAKGGEQFLTIGNFDNIIYPSQAKVSTYVYVDDVSVCECSFKFSLGNDTTLCIGESLILNPNMPNATYTWQDGSHDSTYKVTHSGTYWVKAYFVDYNITTYDTINVSYYPNLIVNLGNDTTLCDGKIIILDATNSNTTYLWQDNSVNPTYSVNQKGVYWVTVSNKYNCKVSDTISIMYKDCDTIRNIIYIYPNPATDNLTIETNFKEEHRLEIINLLGQMIYTTYIGRKSIINTSSYASGLYFLKIYTDKETVVRKFVKE